MTALPVKIGHLLQVQIIIKLPVRASVVGEARHTVPTNRYTMRVDLPRAFRTAYLWVNSRCGLPFQIFLADLLRSPVLKPGVPTL